MRKTDDELRKMSMDYRNMPLCIGLEQQLLQELVDELLALREKTRWIPVGVGEPPLITQDVNCYCEHHREYGVYPAYWDAHLKLFIDDGNNEPVFPAPTHYKLMPPLPSAPDAKGGE